MRARVIGGCLGGLLLLLWGGDVALGQPLTRLRMAVIMLRADSAFQVIGQEKGFYREQGLEMEFVPMQGDAHMMKALIGGSVEFADTSAAGVLIAIDKGAEIKILGSFLPGLSHVLYVRREINSPRDLYGRPVGISAPGTLPHQALVVILQKHGLDPGRVVWTPSGDDSARIRALVAGKIAAAMSVVEFMGVTRTDPNIKILLAMKDEVPEWLRGVMAATTALIRERPQVIVRAIVARAKGVRYALQHREETVQLMARLARKEVREVDWVYDWYVKNKLPQPNGYVSPAALQWMQELNVRLGQQARVHPPDRVATWEFQQRLVAELGTYPW